MNGVKLNREKWLHYLGHNSGSVRNFKKKKKFYKKTSFKAFLGHIKLRHISNAFDCQIIVK